MANPDSLRSDQQRGSCQCGRFIYAAPTEPIALYICHCTECQKQSASAFGISYTIDRASLTIVRGTPSYWSRITASGHTLDCAFCPDCGSRLWHQSTGYPTTLNIKAGSLDKPVDLSNAVHIWVSSKLSGVVIPGDAVIFLQEPSAER